MKTFVVSDVANHNSFKALKVRRYIYRAFYLFNLCLLFIQRGAFQVQQRWGDTNCKVVGVHLVCVSTLQDVMKDANKVFQEGFIRPWKLVRYPGSKMEKGRFEKGGTDRRPQTGALFSALACQMQSKKREVGWQSGTDVDIFAKFPLKYHLFFHPWQLKISIFNHVVRA